MKGPIVLLDAEGNSFAIERTTVALCRCGASTKKPFCDGTYSKIGFRAAQRAVREVAREKVRAEISRGRGQESS